MNSWLFVSLLLAHVIGDFYFQSDHFCKQKEEKGFKSWFLYFHSLTIGLLSWVLVPMCDFWLYALIIVASHFAIDIVKSYFTGRSYSIRETYTTVNETKQRSSCKLSAFIIDQFAHLGVLTAIAFLYHPVEAFYLGNMSTTNEVLRMNETSNLDALLPIQMVDFSKSFSIPLFILAVLLCLKPANIFIKLILEKYQVGESESCNNIKNAGALIGNLERLLTIIFVIIGQYEAIGFIVAAKSILRFKDTDTAKTEYVLAGTFLSFGIAIVCGLMAKM